MDIMDVRAIIIRGFKNGWLQIFVISILLGCISAASVMAAGTIKDLSYFIIFKRMCFVFLLVLSWSFLLLLIFTVAAMPYLTKYCFVKKETAVKAEADNHNNDSNNKTKIEEAAEDTTQEQTLS